MEERNSTNDAQKIAASASRNQEKDIRGDPASLCASKIAMAIAVPGS
jgi:hypothetical protein